MPSQVLEVVEQLRGEELATQRIFNRQTDGVGLRSRRVDPNALAFFGKLLSEAMDGSRRAQYLLQETMTTSDFPNLFGTVLDRQVYGMYQLAPPTYRSYVRVGQVRDFRNAERYAVNGGQGLLTTVKEMAPYPERGLSDAKYAVSVAKYGTKAAFSWEDFINDDLSLLRDMPARMANAARNTEEWLATSMFVDANGPHASFFTSGNKNIVTANPPLTISGLQTAFTVLASQVDSDGNPIVITAVRLVVPPALQIVARNILNATQLHITDAGGGGKAANTTATPSGEQRLIVDNWMRNNVQLDVNAFIPYIATSANGNASWFLFADTAAGQRPAIEIDFLRGHEAPELFMRTPDAIRVGGGAVDVMDGNFDHDAIEYKLRHVLGAAQIDPKMATASNGTGS
jgi:hypothetical protein